MIDHGNQCEDTVILLEVLLHAYDEYEHVFIAKSNMATVAREKQYTQERIGAQNECLFYVQVSRVGR